VTKQSEEDPSSIENKTLEEGIGSVRVTAESLQGAKGVQTAKHLLGTLRNGAKGDESKKAYTERMVEDGEAVLGVKEAS